MFLTGSDDPTGATDHSSVIQSIEAFKKEAIIFDVVSLVDKFDVDKFYKVLC